MTGDPRIVAIVDDDPAVRRAMARLVRSLGFEARAYVSGEAMLEADPRPAPGHVLLDLHLPGLKGPALLTALRGRISGARIVVMTGLDLPGAREACLHAGAAGYMTKPVLRADLLRALTPETGPMAGPA